MARAFVRILTLALGVLLLAGPLQASDEAELRHIKTVLWPQAYRTQDVALLNRLLHDSFEMFDDQGNRSTKSKELDNVAKSPWNPGRYEYQIERLQIYQGAFAVISGTGLAENYSYKSSNFLVKENGIWQAIASHVSGFTPKARRKAIFIILDGIPADVVERVATPTIDEIAGIGGYTRAFVGGMAGWPSESPTVSAVGYNTLLTGTWSNKHNVWDNRVTKPNYRYWDIFRIAKAHDAALKTALFSTWQDNRTKLLGDGLPEAGGTKLDYHFDGFEYDTTRFPHDLESRYIADIDALVSQEAARYIAAEGPDLSWVYLQYTDDVGHRSGDGIEMDRAVRTMDDQLGRIWAAVKDRREQRAEDWMVIVTTDHGRDSKTGKNHGQQSVRERTIWIATNSVNLNRHFENRPAMVDILPSLASHLRLSIPPDVKAGLDGRSFVDN